MFNEEKNLLHLSKILILWVEGILMILSEIQTILMIFVCGCSMNPIKPICLWKLVYSSLLWTLRRCMQLYLMDYALIFHSLKIYMYKDPSLKIHMYKDTRVPVFHISLCDLAEGQ